MQNVFSPAEQEHYDHVVGSASEAQNCFFEAGLRRAQLNDQHSAPIIRALSLGLHVVVREVFYFCKATDAFAGTYQVFVCAFNSREAAEAKIQALYAREGYDEEAPLNIVEPRKH